VFVTCDNCGGRFRIAPEKVPASGVRARCAGCASILLLRREGDRVVVAPATPRHAPQPAPSADLPPEYAAPHPPPPAAATPGPRQPLPPPLPVPEPDVELPEEGPPPSLPPPPPAHEDDSPWGALPQPEAPPPPPPDDDDPFASLEAPPLPAEVSFGNVGTLAPSDEVKEPSFVTGAIPLDERSARGSSAAAAPAALQRTRSRLLIAARKAPVEGPVSKTIWSVVVVGALVYGVLVGLHRDPTHLVDTFLPGGRGGSLRTGEVVSGVYPASDGGRLTYLTGEIEGGPVVGEGEALRVVGEILDAKGSVVSRSEGWAGALPAPEQLAAVVDDASWRHLARVLARSGRTDGMPFVVAFPGAKPPAGTVRFQIKVREEPLPPSADQVVRD